MSSVRFIKNDMISSLVAMIEENLERYQEGDFNDFGLDKSEWSFASSKTTYEPRDLASLTIPTNGNFFETENSIKVLKAFEGLTRFQAVHPGLWTYHCHADGVEYIRNRWEATIRSKDKKVAVDAIKKRFFATSDLRHLRRNVGLARLWWNAKLFEGAFSRQMFEKMEPIMNNTDIRSSLIERTGLSLSNAFIAAVEYIYQQDILRKAGEPDSEAFFLRSSDKASHFSYRDLFKFLNRLGGVKDLNALQVDDILGMIKAHASSYSG